jgi:hypothetical protein
MPKDVDLDPREQAKQQRRITACVEACKGLPTDGLERVASMDISIRPWGMAKLAMRRASN